MYSRARVLASTLFFFACSTTTSTVETPAQVENVAQSGSRGLRLTILHNNDGESQLIHAGAGIEDFGGLARFTALLTKLRKEAVADSSEKKTSGVLVLGAGDIILPGPEFAASQRRGGPLLDALALSAIRYNAIGIGNHDFDLGPDVLAKLIEDSAPDVPYLSANLDFSREPKLQALVSKRRIVPFTTVDVGGGYRIGVIGLTTPTLKKVSSPRNVTASDDLAAIVLANVASLEGQGINKIILVSHLQSIDEDIALIKKIRGVDVVVSGGGGELLSNKSRPLVVGDETVVHGPYPIQVKDAENRTVPIVTTAGSYKYIGRLVVEFEAKGRIVAIDSTSDAIRVAGGRFSDAVEEDPTVKSTIVNPLTDALGALSASVVAKSEVPLEGRHALVRSQETNFGDLIADALLWQAKKLSSSHDQPEPRVAFVNGGAIRNDSAIPAGNITELDTFDALPFKSVVAIVPNVSPEELAAVLNHSVKSRGGGGFLQVSGMQLVVSTSEDAHDRIIEAKLNDGTVLIKDGQPILGAPSINVATLSFLAQGGGGSPLGGKPFANLGCTYQKALSNYLSSDEGLKGLVSAKTYPAEGLTRIRQIGPASASNF